MKLYEPSIFTWNIEDTDTITFTDTTPTQALFAVDNDRETLVRSDTANPSLILTLATGRTGTASSVWVKVLGYTNVEVIADSESLGSVAISTTGALAGYAYLEFTETTARRWILLFTGVGGVWEAYLQRQILDFNTDDKRPQRTETLEIPGVFMRSKGGVLINFNEFSFSGGAATITMEWEALSDEATEELLVAWRSGTPRSRELGVYPKPTYEPNFFYQAKWVSNFAFVPSGEAIEDAYAGSAVFEELPNRL